MSEEESIQPMREFLGEPLPPVGGEAVVGAAAPAFAEYAPPPLPDPFWGWHDFWLFLMVLLLAMAIALAGASSWQRVMHWGDSAGQVLELASEFIGWAMGFWALRWMFRMQYGAPLFPSLHMSTPRFSFGLLVIVGQLQALFIALLGGLLQTPNTDTPMSKLLEDRPTAVALALAGIALAPLAEELAFRGFLQPLLIRTLGLLPGIAVTSMLFGAIHLSQYGYQWQSFLLISVAGMGFGIMRQATGSTRASVYMHAGYNAALFAMFFLSKGR